MNKNYNY